VNHGAVAAKVGRNDSCPCGSGKKYNLNQGPAIRLNPLNGATSNYTYDPIYELTQVVHGTTTTESYSYDGVRNRLSLLGMSQYNYNPSNDLISTPSGSYTYDADGNTLTDASGKACTWDFENRLVQAVVPGTVTFKHDPLGRRIQKSPPSGATNYLYDGMSSRANVAEELDNSGNVLTRYTQSRNVDEPLSEVRSGTTSYYEQDGLAAITRPVLANGNQGSTHGLD
jgi:YD repeat-containing protein